MRPNASSSWLGAPSSRPGSGRRGHPRTARRAPCASLSQRRRQSARAQFRAVLRCSARREPRRPRGGTISRSPLASGPPSPGGSPRPRPQPLALTHPLGSAPRGLLPAHVGCFATAPRHASCLLLIGCRRPGRPARRAIGALAVIPPSRLSDHPAPLSFPTQGVKGGGTGRRKGEAASDS